MKDWLISAFGLGVFALLFFWGYSCARKHCDASECEQRTTHCLHVLERSNANAQVCAAALESLEQKQLGQNIADVSQASLIRARIGGR